MSRILPRSNAILQLIRLFFMLKIFNSIAREKQEFVPLVPGEVKIYVCGMTVYDY